MKLTDKIQIRNSQKNLDKNKRIFLDTTDHLTKKDLEKLAIDVYFIPEGLAKRLSRNRLLAQMRVAARNEETHEVIAKAASKPYAKR